jgi:hypothetical protein
MIGDKYDATSPLPRTARDVTFEGERYARDGLETAWLLLQEHSGCGDSYARTAAIRGMRTEGWAFEQALTYVQAAMSWTGNVVQGPATR